MLKVFTTCFVLCAGACAPAYAQDDTRASQIDSARTQKEGNLTPETPPRAESRIESIEDSAPYRLLTGEFDGFGLGFGAIIPGSGFAVIPRYTRRDLFGGRMTLRINALAAIKRKAGFG